MIPQRLQKFSSQVLYFLIVPSFLFFFAIVYRPFDIQHTLSMGRELFAFNVTIITSIVFVALVISRVILYYTKRLIILNYFWYTIWCMVEMIVTSFFVALFLWLMFKMEVPYFHLLTESIKALFLISMYPYFVITLSLIIMDYRKDKNSKETPTFDASTHIRFCDMNGSEKLVIAIDSLLYISAQENYVRIYYLEDGKVTSYLLRNTMKKLEEKGLSKQIVRCHRSYFVNTSRVKLLKKEREGVVFAEIDAPQPIKIPVTNTYYDALAQIF